MTNSDRSRDAEAQTAKARRTVFFGFRISDFFRHSELGGHERRTEKDASLGAGCDAPLRCVLRPNVPQPRPRPTGPDAPGAVEKRAAGARLHHGRAGWSAGLDLQRAVDARQ